MNGEWSNGIWRPRGRIIPCKSFLPGAFPSGAAQQSSSTPMSVAFVTSQTNQTDLTSYTFSNISIGAADTTRRIFVAAASFQAVLSTITVGGASAAIHVSQADVEDDSYIAIASVKIAAGTTADIVVNLAAIGSGCGIGIWRAINEVNSVPYATASDAGTSSSPSLTINVPSNGVLIAASSWDAGPPTGTAWTGASEDYDDIYDASAVSTGASETGLTSETNRSVGNTRSGTMIYEGPLAALTWQ